MANIEVSLVTPGEVLWEGEAQMVAMRTVDGEIAFLSGHMPLIGQVAPGLVRIQLAEGGEERFAVRGGFVEVNANLASVLADEAVGAGQVDAEAARRDLEAAESDLEASGDSADREGEAAAAEVEVAWARARLELAES